MTASVRSSLITITAATFGAGIVVGSLVVIAKTQWTTDEECTNTSKMVFCDRIDRSSVFPFEIDGNPEALSFADDPDDAQRKAIRIVLDRTDRLVPSRIELVPEHILGFNEGYLAPFGMDVWYAFKMRLPVNFEPDEELETLLQFHDIGDLPQLFGHLPPPLQFYIKNNTWVVNANWDRRLLPTLFGGGVEHRSIEALGSITHDLGRWTSWVIHARWAYNNEQRGKIVVWKDGAVILDRDGPNTYRDIRGGPYFKLGIYKWAWPHSVNSTTSKREIMIRDVCISVVEIDRLGTQCDLQSRQPGKVARRTEKLR